MNRPLPTHSRVTLAEVIGPPELASGKQEALCRLTLLACILVAAASGRASAQMPDRFRVPEDETGFAVRLAVEGAATRLAGAGCRELFADFSDATGQRLSTTLAASGKSPAEAFGLLRFSDNRETPLCRSGVTLAFTLTGSRFIRVCGRHFRNEFMRNRTTAENVLIHELLHALGLGENPPSSNAITRQVAVRCGG